MQAGAFLAFSLLLLRCASSTNVSLPQPSLIYSPIQSGFELVVPSTVLQYVEFKAECRFRGFLSDNFDHLSVGDLLVVNVTGHGKDVYSAVVRLQEERVESISFPLMLTDLNGNDLFINFRVGKEAVNASAETFVIPGPLSLLPAVVILIVAIASKQVLLALYSGIFVGATMANYYNPLLGFLRSIDLYMYSALGSSNLGLLLFTMFMAAMIGVISKSGGILGVAKLLRKFARTPRRSLLATYTFGLLIFFDDYTNSLVVGPTMRPLSDTLYISREKLAFIVDATSAPIVSIAFISSWIGFEVGLIQQQFDKLGIERDAYLAFVQTIPMRYYSFLMLLFVLFIILTRRDFGPMLKAEKRAGMQLQVISPKAKPAANTAEDKDLMPAESTPARWANGIIPIFVLITSIGLGMYFDGAHTLSVEVEEGRQTMPVNASAGEALALIVASADAARVLLWSSFGSLLIAMLLPLTQRILKFTQIVDAAIGGIKAVMGGILILIFAWAIGNVSDTLQTGAFFASVIGSSLPPQIIPAIAMVLSAVVSFATGSSWGAMAILFPLVVPLAHSAGDGDEFAILTSISSILAGSIFGDHCSPISDTTVFSSMATSCDHIDHVKTQIPYSLLVGALALICSTVVPFVGQWFAPIALAICAGLLLGCIFLFGRVPPRAHAPTPEKESGGEGVPRTPMSTLRRPQAKKSRMQVFWQKVVYTFSPPKVRRRLLSSPNVERDTEMIRRRLRDEEDADGPPTPFKRVEGEGEGEEEGERL